MHGRVFSNKRANSSLYFLASSLVWSNPSFFKNSHLYHHAKTFSEDDTEAKGVQKWGMANVFFYLTIDIPLMVKRLFYTIVNSLGFKYVNGAWLNISKAHQIAALFTLLFQTLFAMIIFYFTQNILFVVLWLLLPFTGQLINRLLAQSQHIGLIAGRELGPLKYSRSIELPKLITFLYAGMNYHAEHHLMPSMPYYNLAKASKLLVKFYGHKVIHWRKFYGFEFLPLLKSIKSN
jgi:fatty acid desaturase